MERRKALKNMGMAMGLTLATPTVISILQSCQQEAGTDWTPVFFSEGEGAVLVKLVDIILPKTDTPAASELQVHAFIDSYMEAVPPAEEQDFMRMAFGAFIDKALADSGKEAAEDLTVEDLEPVLAESLAKKTPEEEAVIMEAIGSYQEAVESGQEATLDEAISRYSFANNLRGSVIWAYKNTEYIGEEVLAYQPVPGEYIPCGDVDELTGGKAWSI
ncbi:MULTISPECIES: gluconate 2-dehydrogenase subunit 3 family protein [unclassified Robiginitalea]|uniref:gluconate 2-dehydrogenase subunit 3 family protein n=1 Tax=Robiginitalea TaxID=252306 RepID=UPI00234AEA77|nr:MULTISPECIES: gluconate 2-dehydrogenase subunit 3 family protein [unclassified Robiginitalea]MDC6353357.1 gluconate 2-dehydrogenase subunit 3 family protein [Robiginitalea sp. PM2]MDC6373478.1 gluconate 2-dehydrogenase subunit 3 family protein [Robiginitalea sp. SP8]